MFGLIGLQSLARANDGLSEESSKSRRRAAINAQFVGLPGYTQLSCRPSLLGNLRYPYPSYEQTKILSYIS